MKIIDVTKSVNGYFCTCNNCRKYYPDIDKMVSFGDELNPDSYLCFNCVDEMQNLFLDDMTVEEFADYASSILDNMKECGIE